MIKLKLFKRKSGWGLTWFSRILIIAILLLLFIWGFKGLNSYLCLNKPLASNLLVVEGFLPDYTLQNMMTEFHDGGYNKLLITGKPIGQSYYLTGYNTSAELMRSTLIRLGMDSSLIYTSSIPNTVYRDRTYSTGLLLKHWLDTTSINQKRVNIYTLGCHARRSLYLFEKALGDKIEVGIISGEDRSYTADKWWKSSKGFRTVLNESLAYLYVRLFFKADNETALKEIIDGYYIDEINHHRLEKDMAYVKEGSPLTDEQRETFVHLNYYKPNEKYKIKALFTLDEVKTEFKMKTSTDRLPTYRNYGKLHFKINGEEYTLTAYQNMDYLAREGSDQNYLFIPFRDYTSGDVTYGAGRYLNFSIPQTDSVYIDFNLAYNPYCAYNPRYSCPIPPAENTLHVEIKAGELIFEKH